MTELTQEQQLSRIIDEFDDLRASQLTPEKFDELFQDQITRLEQTNSDLVRKMRFGGDKLAGSKFARLGAADVDWLHNIMETQRDLGRRGPSEDLQNAFKEVVSDQSREFVREDDWAVPTPYQRAMDTQESGFGQQLIGTQYSGSLWDVARELGVIAPLIPSFDMTAPTAYLPVEAGFPEMLAFPESTTYNATNFTTSKTPSQRVSVTAAKSGIHQMWSGEMEEDSIIAFVPFLRMQAARSIAYYTDSAILNGDTTTGGAQINTSSDPAGTFKHYLNYDGIRHAALVDNTANGLNVGGVVTLDTFRALRALMRDDTRKVDWGHPVNRGDLIFIADPDTSDRVDLLDEVINAKLRNGNTADLLNGQTASILGHPVLRTMAQSKALATGFIHASSGNSYGQLTALNTSGIVLGWRRRVKVEVERIPATDQTRIVYTLRNGLGRFTPTGAASGIEWTATGYNIAV